MVFIEAATGRHPSPIDQTNTAAHSTPCQADSVECNSANPSNPATRARREPASPFASRLAGCGFAALAALVMLGPVFANAQETAPEPSESTRSASPIALAQFTTGIENREPIDQITFVGSKIQKIFFFSDIRGLEGTTIHHRWILAGETMADVIFEVSGPRWRVWSSKELMPDWIGDWTVEIVTAEGEVLAAETFTYSAPDA